jgi:proteasome accessory factor A
MSVRRIMGSETEYGISVPAAPSMNAMQASSLVVNSYAQRTVGGTRARWDFEEENPLRDARGFEAAAPPLVDPSAPANEDDLGLANLILTNGA